MVGRTNDEKSIGFTVAIRLGSSGGIRGGAHFVRGLVGVVDGHCVCVELTYGTVSKSKGLGGEW